MAEKMYFNVGRLLKTFLKFLRFGLTVTFVVIVGYWGYKAVVKLQKDNIASSVIFKNGDDHHGGVHFPMVTICPKNLLESVETSDFTDTRCTNSIEKGCGGFDWKEQYFWAYILICCMKSYDPEPVVFETTTIPEFTTSWNLYSTTTTEPPEIKWFETINETMKIIELDLSYVLDSYYFSGPKGRILQNDMSSHDRIGNFKEDFYTFYDSKHGPCWTFDPSFLFKNKTTPASYLDLNFNFAVYKGSYFVILHERREDRTKMIWDTTSHLVIKDSDSFMIRFKKTVIESLPSKRTTCTDDPFYDRDACLEEKTNQEFVDKHGCRMPWMEQLQDWNFTRNQTGLCLGLDEIVSAGMDPNKTLPVSNRASKWYNDFVLYWHLAVERHSQDCPLVPRCTRTIYDTYKEPFDSDSVGPMKAKLRIALADRNIQHITDGISYNTQSFIGEVGGTLGLFLGLSFLSFVDFLDYLLSKCINITSNF